MPGGGGRLNAAKRRKKVVSLHGQGVKVSESNIEMIRERAYELFLARGATHGADLADWLEAEQELHAAYQR